MSFGTFVAKLNPFLSKKNQLEVACARAREEIETTIIPTLERTFALYKGVEFKSAFAKRLASSFAKYPNLKARSGSWIDTLNTAYPIILKNISTIERLVKAHPNEVMNTASIMFSDVTVLNFQNAILFTNQYTMIMLANFMGCEQNVLDEVQETAGMTPGEIEFLQKNLEKYLQAMNSLYTEPNRLAKAMQDIPKTVFKPEEENITFSIGDQAKFDPMGFRFLPLPINPFFIVGKAWVEYQESRYNALNVDKMRIETRIQIIESRRNGGNSPNEERTLAALEKRRRDIYRALDKYEEN